MAACFIRINEPVNFDLNDQNTRLVLELNS